MRKFTAYTSVIMAAVLSLNCTGTSTSRNNQNRANNSVGNTNVGSINANHTSKINIDLPDHKSQSAGAKPSAPGGNNQSSSVHSGKESSAGKKPFAPGITSLRSSRVQYNRRITKEDAEKMRWKNAEKLRLEKLRLPEYKELQRDAIDRPLVIAPSSRQSTKP